MAKRRILVVDDEENYAKLLKMHLEAIGKFEVYYENDGEKAHEAAIEYKPEVILLDIVMPKISGVEILSELKKDERTLYIPVIILTAIDTQELKENVFERYAEDFIAKPADAKVLISKIEAVLSRMGRF